jgi:hypothetical protein
VVREVVDDNRRLLRENEVFDLGKVRQ